MIVALDRGLDERSIFRDFPFSVVSAIAFINSTKCRFCFGDLIDFGMKCHRTFYTLSMGPMLTPTLETNKCYLGFQAGGKHSPAMNTSQWPPFRVLPLPWTMGILVIVEEFSPGQSLHFAVQQTHSLGVLAYLKNNMTCSQKMNLKSIVSFWKYLFSKKVQKKMQLQLIFETSSYTIERLKCFGQFKN